MQISRLRPEFLVIGLDYSKKIEISFSLKTQLKLTSLFKTFSAFLMVLITF